jgi:hypothetical protein
MKIHIDDRYLKENEIRLDYSPYKDYFECLREVFDLNNIDGFCDVGCANGPLLYHMKKNYPGSRILGLEYFDWQKKAAHISVMDSIIVHDMRDSVVEVTKQEYEIVNCTETAEHIDPDYTNIFLENLKTLSSKWIIISWAETGGINDRIHDDLLQHLNPLKREVFEELLISHGFKKEEELSARFIKESLNKDNFYFWWRQSLGIWKIK